jgi:hypothetical protein
MRFEGETVNELDDICFDGIIDTCDKRVYITSPMGEEDYLRLDNARCVVIPENHSLYPILRREYSPDKKQLFFPWGDWE